MASLAEAIVPGSTDAGVAPFVDRLLAEDTPEGQRAFLAALGAIQAEATARLGRPWLGLDARAEGRAAHRRVGGPALTGAAPLDPGAAGARPRRRRRLPPTLRDRFDLLKERIATAYYSSEAGMKELGWTGHLIHEAFPGCPHPGGHGPRPSRPSVRPMLDARVRDSLAAHDS